VVLRCSAGVQVVTALSGAYVEQRAKEKNEPFIPNSRVTAKGNGCHKEKSHPIGTKSGSPDKVNATIGRVNATSL